MIRIRSYREIPRLLRTPFGRMELWKECLGRSWPVLREVARWYRRLVLFRTCVIVVTGTYGKTTTQRAITAALGMEPDAVERANFQSGVAKALLLTPPWHRFAPFEVGIFGPGQMIQYARMMEPDIAVVNSIGTEHQRTFKTLENTRDEKAQLLTGIAPHGTAILNGDDPHVLWMRGTTTRRVITYGFDEGNDVRVSNWQTSWPEGSRFQVHLSGMSYPIRTRLHGRHMVYPVLAALAVVHATNQSMNTAVTAMERLTPARGRMNVVALPNGARIIQDDYKSSLETIETALDFLRSIPAARRLVLLGSISEPPNPQRQVYRRFGHRFAQFADIALLLASKDRCQSYASGAVAAGMPRERIMKFHNDLRQAINVMRDILQPGDVLVVKGRLDDHLERITLALSGQKVGCWRTECSSRAYRCNNCPMLEKGW
jgi:UDP-N-acetylmuramoyl-tripeptide--D-alanyl-D-alanine ligase